MGSSEQAIAILRAWRHEMANDLQAVTGWLQLGQTDRALESGLALAARLRRQGALLHLKSPAVALALLEAWVRARRDGLALGLEVGSDLEGLDRQEELAAAISRLLKEASAQLAGSSEARLNLVVAEDAEGYRFDLESNGPVATLRWPREAG